MMRLKGDFLDAGVNMSLDNDKHLESIVLLQKSNRKSKPDTYVKISLNMEDYYRIMDADGGAKIE